MDNSGVVYWKRTWKRTLIQHELTTWKWSKTCTALGQCLQYTLVLSLFPHRPVLPSLSLRSSSLRPPILTCRKMGLTWDSLGTYLGLTRLCERTESWVWFSLNPVKKVLPSRHVWNEFPECQTALSRILWISSFSYSSYRLQKGIFHPAWGHPHTRPHVTVICKNCKI